MEKTQEVVDKIKLFEDKLNEIQEAIAKPDISKEEVEQVKSLQNEVKEMQKELKERLEKLDTVEKKRILGRQDKSERQVMEDTIKFFKACKVGDVETIKALSEGADGDGGYLVPTGFSNKVIEIQRQYGLIRRLATQVPMTTPSIKFPKLDDSALAFGYVKEGVKKPGKKVSFGQVELKTLKVAGIIPVTEELIADSNVDLMPLLTRAIGRGMSKFEDTEAFSGAGGNDAFEGILVNASVPNVTFVGKTAFSDLKTEYEKLSDMIDAIDPVFLGNAKFVAHPKIIGYLRTAKDGDGRLIWNPASAGTPENIWSYPLERSLVLPGPTETAANKKFMVFGDFSNIYFGQRQGLAVKLLDQATITDSDGQTVINLAEQDMIGIRAVERIAIKIVEPTAFATLKTASSAS